MVNKVIILTPGTTNWVVPTDFNAVSRVNSVWLIGGGGGGGAAGEFSDSGGGGEGGAFAQLQNIVVNPGDVIPVTVGAGGAGGVPQVNEPGQNGGHGGSTSFGTTGFAPGGAGGGFQNIGGLTTPSQLSLCLPLLGAAIGGAGGNGGYPNFDYTSALSGGGGGGAGGPLGNGGLGASQGIETASGGGGGAANGGSTGIQSSFSLAGSPHPSTDGNGGAGGNSLDGTLGGLGGLQGQPGLPGFNGSGGGAGGSANSTGINGGVGGAGGNGPGGGPGGGGGGGGSGQGVLNEHFPLPGNGGNGGPGGLYGGGGGGGGKGLNWPIQCGSGGAGGSGAIIIIYQGLVTPVPGITFAEVFDPAYLDFSDEDYTSFALCSYVMNPQNPITKLQSPYLLFYFNTNGVTNAADVSVRWGYALDTTLGKISTTQRLTTTDTASSQYTGLRRKFRGSGRAFQVAIYSVTGQPFDISGWVVENSMNTQA